MVAGPKRTSTLNRDTENSSKLLHHRKATEGFCGVALASSNRESYLIFLRLDPPMDCPICPHTLHQSVKITININLTRHQYDVEKVSVAWFYFTYG